MEIYVSIKVVLIHLSSNSCTGFQIFCNYIVLSLSFVGMGCHHQIVFVTLCHVQSK